jgi:hypothetical protein
MAAKVAELELGKLIGRQTLSVRVPRDIAGNDFAKLGESIVDIIHNHTGCTCLSGVIDVVIHEDFQEALRVELR